MTRPRKPSATAERKIGGLTAVQRAWWKREIFARLKGDPDGRWVWVPSSKVVFFRDVAAHRKNAREGMARKRAADKAKAAAACPFCGHTDPHNFLICKKLQENL